MIDGKDTPSGKFAELFQVSDETNTDGPKKRGRPAGTRASSFTKDTLKSAFDTLNMALLFTMPEYALNEDEIKALTVAWYDVIKEYPSMGRMLVQGKKFTVWGQALFTTYVVVSKRMPPTPKTVKGKATNTATTSETVKDNTAEHPSSFVPVLG